MMSRGGSSCGAQAAHGFPCCGAKEPGARVSAVAARGLGGCGAPA